jgi:hypothetical protein
MQIEMKQLFLQFVVSLFPPVELQIELKPFKSDDLEGFAFIQTPFIH